MRLVYINPNATETMTRGIVAAARAALPGVEISGMTNLAGPAAIEGPEDGEAALPGLLACVAQARDAGASAIVIACFDDTGLADTRARAGCPVLGIGQSAYVMATLLGLRFSVVTSLPVSVPVIRQNVEAGGFGGFCASIRASGLAVLTIDEAGDATRARIAEEIAAARDDDGAEAVILGCAGMAPMAGDLATRSGVRLVDGVAASAHLAAAAAGFSASQGGPAQALSRARQQP
ncbi:aspartate/glutamate racemase family protein [Sulfitobacter sp. LCG007]